MSGGIKGGTRDPAAGGGEKAQGVCESDVRVEARKRTEARVEGGQNRCRGRLRLIDLHQEGKIWKGELVHGGPYMEGEMWEVLPKRSARFQLRQLGKGEGRKGRGIAVEQSTLDDNGRQAACTAELCLLP